VSVNGMCLGGTKRQTTLTDTCKARMYVRF